MKNKTAFMMGMALGTMGSIIAFGRPLIVINYTKIKNKPKK